MATRWFRRTSGGELGPSTLLELAAMLRNGTLREEDRVRMEHGSQWISVRDVIGLRQAAGPVATEAASPAEPQVRPQQSQGPVAAAPPPSREASVPPRFLPAPDGRGKARRPQVLPSQRVCIGRRVRRRRRGHGGRLDTPVLVASPAEPQSGSAPRSPPGGALRRRARGKGPAARSRFGNDRARVFPLPERGHADDRLRRDGEPKDRL